MATAIAAVPAIQPAAIVDPRLEISNAIDARERVKNLIASLETQRTASGNLFLKTFAGELAAVPGEPDRAFVDGQFAKYTAWKTADEETGKRIVALNTIGDGLQNRIETFKTAHRDQLIALLTERIAALEDMLAKQESQEEVLARRLEALRFELDQLSQRSTGPARKGKP